jgi:hypothetical protein
MMVCCIVIKAVLQDLFALREELGGGYTGASPGSEVYRSPNSTESIAATHAFDQLGYRKEAESDMRVFFDGQEDDGCWASSKGWEHECWGAAYFLWTRKSNSTYACR